MGVLDRFLNAMKLNDNDGFDDDDFLDDEMVISKKKLQKRDSSKSRMKKTI